jgi:hypothetical protein
MKTIKLMMIALMMCFVTVSCGPSQKELQDEHNRKVELNAKLERDTVIIELKRRLSISDSAAKVILLEREASGLEFKRNLKKQD